MPKCELELGAEARCGILFIAAREVVKALGAVTAQPSQVDFPYLINSMICYRMVQSALGNYCQWQGNVMLETSVSCH